MKLKYGLTLCVMKKETLTNPNLVEKDVFSSCHERDDKENNRVNI